MRTESRRQKIMNNVTMKGGGGGGGSERDLAVSHTLKGSS